MTRVAAAVVVGLVLALVGADAASAQGGAGQGGSGNDLRVKTKTVEKFIKRKALIAYRAVPTVFPNAQFEPFDPRDILDDGDLYLHCSPAPRILSRKHLPIWACLYIIFLYEENRSNPDQWTQRSCDTPAGSGYSIKKSPLLYVERAKSSRKLRIKGAWRMTCEIDEQTIAWWNESGDDYYPDISSSESTPYEVVQSDQGFIEPRDDLLPAPSGTPGAPPGPLGAGPPAPGRSAHGKAARGWVLSYCTAWSWMRFSNGTYAVYSCFWNDAGLGALPGANLNIFATQTYYASYYWTGNYAGNDVWRLFQSGYGTGPVAGSAYP